MPTHAEAESLLVAAAASHGLAIAPHQIRAALADGPAGDDLARWAASNLSADNLLTVDELYNSLDASGQVDKLLAEVQQDDDLSDMTPPLAAHDVLAAAVDDFARSTAALGKQSETLRHRRAAYERLLANRAQAYAARRELEASRRLKLDSERVRVESEITEIAHGLEFRIAELTTNNNRQSLSSAIDPILRSDDALLTSLQKLGWELSEPDPDEAKSTDKLRETCLRLIKITVETIRTRLDATYLTALATTAQHNQDSYTTTATGDPDDTDALEAELESLYAEVLPVAQMSVEQQHLEPALAAVTGRTGRGMRKTASSLAYTDRCLEHLLARTNALHTHAKLHAAHHRAVNRVVATARDEMASDVPSPSPPTSAASPVKPPPMRSKRLSRDLSQHHRRRSSGVHEVPALDTLMQALALPIDSHGGDGRSSALPSRVANLSRLLRERRQKNAAAARMAQDELEAAAGECLVDARRAVQRLRDSVLAETPFGSGPGSLADPGIEQSVDVLAQEVHKAQVKLDRVDVGEMGWGSLKRDDFIERWAR